MLNSTDIITNDILPQASTHLLYPWFLPGRLALFVGTTNVGKTTLTLEIIAGMLKGDHLWDRFPCHQITKVLYLHAEHTLATLQEAAKARGDIPQGAVTVVHDFGPLGSSLVEKGKLNLVLAKEIKATVEEIQPQLIVVEPISAFLGESENSNLEVRLVVNFFANLGEKYGAAVMAHHHTGKIVHSQDYTPKEGIASGEARGAMAFEDSAERVVYLHRKKLKDSSHLKIETVKTKGFPVSPVTLTFDEDTLTYNYVPQPIAERDLLSVYNRRRRYPKETIRDLIDFFRSTWSASGGEGASPNKVMLLLKRAAKVGLLLEDGWQAFNHVSSPPVSIDPEVN